MDDVIHFKDRLLVELVRWVILWTTWLECNNVCFNNASPSTPKSLGSKILSFASFWCASRNDDSHINLSLIRLFDVKDIPDELLKVEEGAMDLITAVEILVSMSDREASRDQL